MLVKVLIASQNLKIALSFNCILMMIDSITYENSRKFTDFLVKFNAKKRVYIWASQGFYLC